MRKTPLLLLIIVAILPYTNTLKNEFVGYDDQNLIQHSREIRSLAPGNIAHMFVPRTRGNYQPIRTLSYALDYALWGARPFGFHLTNILLHALTVVGVWLLVRRLLPEPVPFLAALIFAVHPIHVESVTWMSARKDVLALAFFLFAILSYEKSERNGTWPYVASILLTALALLSKLTAVSLPLCILLHEICRDGWPRVGGFARKLVRLTPHVLLVFLVVALNFAHSGATSSHGDALASLERTSSALAQDIRLSMPLVVCRYIGLLLAPYGLVTHYDVARVSRIADPRALLPIVILSALIISGVVCFFKGRKTQAFGIGWFFITLLPASNIIPTASMMNDRYMHMPSIGFSILLAMALAYPARTMRRKSEGSAWPLTIMPVILVVLLLSTLTIRRNTDWRNTETLFSRTLRINSRSVDARLALGAIYGETRDYDSAIKMYRDALEVDPGNYRVLYNLGVAYTKKGWFHQAIKALEDSRAANPDFIPTRFNLALAYHEQGQYQQAIAEHREVLRINPRRAASHGDLGRIYLKMGQTDLALMELNEALDIQPNLTPALIDRARLFMQQDWRAEAEKDIQRLESLGVNVQSLRSQLQHTNNANTK
ncbi:MAG: tetratricopeptide repeat protein [Candidatus Abyssobacteria bacterium SURF_17]|uniref:Tetratricopeptide repeat protein n=1 Tax=Candidatus Abyssobacteria bacterium SURF_17 TaxID=2093361 RepID=A0A419EZZ7_9BACT|nr:MAG: tetratricopeptide repeat protein [Candidatus Abyssubacteria bacterium SURF_17]